MSRRRYYDDDENFGYFHPSKPIATDQGIKAKSKRGAFTKNWWAERWIAALEGLQKDAVTYPLVKRTPCRASESIFGVGICELPWQPSSPYPRSSTTIKRRFGGGCFSAERI